MSLDSATFRSTLGRFASGVTVVTARDAEGRDHGMTVSAFASVSLEPPLVLACIDRAASMFELLRTTTHVGVNILAAPQEALSRRFASVADSPFDGVGFVRAASGVVLLDDVLAQLECRVHARHDAGDHMLVILAVESAAVTEQKPLLYFSGGYGGLA